MKLVWNLLQQTSLTCERPITSSLRRRQPFGSFTSHRSGRWKTNSTSLRTTTSSLSKNGRWLTMATASLASGRYSFITRRYDRGSDFTWLPRYLQCHDRGKSNRGISGASTSVAKCLNTHLSFTMFKCQILTVWWDYWSTFCIVF